MGETEDARKVDGALNSHMENGRRNSFILETVIGCLLCSKPWESKSKYNGQGGLSFSLGRR